MDIPELVRMSTPEDPGKKLYFDNNKVEDLMLRYRWTGCTNIYVRDRIMVNAEELIRQIIRAHNLHKIYLGQEESAFMDLFQTAWVQIEKTLYKYKARPHCADCYYYLRPFESCLHTPGDIEYNILSLSDIVKLNLKCPNKRCDNFNKIPNRVVYRGMSKVFNMWCVRPETLIYSTNGINTIEKVAGRIGYDDKQEIWTIGKSGNPSKIIAGVRKPERRVLDIRVESGFEIGCTPEHMLWSDEWIKAKDLKIGDLIRIDYNQQFYINDDTIDVKLKENEPGCSGVVSPNWSPPNKFNEELSYICGLYIAEGSISHGQLAIYNIDHDVIDKLVNNNLNLKFIHYPDRQCVVCNNKRFIEFMSNMGFGSKAVDKIIPQKLLMMSKSNIAAMLSGMFDGDGHSSIYNGTVGYTSVNLKLINQLRMILLNMGIFSKIQVDNRKQRKFKDYISNSNKSYQLNLSTNDSRIFYDEIGFKINRKQLKNKKLKTPKQYIYGLNDKFRKLYDKYGCGKYGYDKIRTIIRKDRNKCLASVANKLLKSWNNFAYDDDYKFIESRMNKYYNDDTRSVWLPIVKIDEGYSEVCEISVDSDDHSYIANGIVSHNSQVARTVILAYIKKESRDYKNSDSYKVHLGNKKIKDSDPFLTFLEEAKRICKYNKNFMIIINSLEELVKKDPKPYEGIISKLVNSSGQSRSQVISFLKMIRLRCDEFTGSPINDNTETIW